MSMYRHEDMIKINHDSGLRRVERRRNQAEERVILANEAARKAASRMSRIKLDRIRRKRGEEARERDRPNYDKMHPNKVLAARVFHQLYLLTVKKHKRAIDVFRDFDTDDSGTVDRAEFAAGCVALGMNLGGGKADDEVFDAIDEDGSGELDYWEVEKAIKRAGKYPPPYPKQEVNPQNIVATHFTDMKEGFRAILKFKAKLRKTREEEEMKKSKKLHALKTGQGEESSSSDEEDENKTPSNLQKIMNKRSSDIGISIKKTKTNNTVDDDSEDDYDDDEDQFEDDEEIQEERTPQQKSEVEKLRSKISNQIHVHNSDSDDEPKEYTLKDLAMWVNMDDPAEIINNPAVARAAASVPQAVRRVAAKLHKLMKRERLGIKTMFECLDTDGSGILEVNELHDGLRQYLDIDLSLDELKVVLDHCDKSMDGQISFVEFEKAFLWADMKRMARIVKRQNHADRRHYKMRKRHRNKVAKEKSQCGIYRVPDDVPLPTKEEQASFPNGKPRKLPFWLRPRDSPHSRPWMNKNRIKSDLSCASDGNDSILEDRRTVLRKERHQKRCAKLGVKQTKLSEARKIHHSKVIHASDILSHMDDKSTKNQPTKTKTKTHHREHVKTLPPEIGQPIMPPRITANELEETAKTGVGMMRAIQRRRARVSGGGSQQHDRPKSKQHNSPTAKQRMIDARDLYTTPPVLYGAKDGQGFSTSPPKIRLPQNIKRVSSKQLLLSAMRAVGVLEDKVNAQHLNKACDEIFNFRVVTNEGEDLDLHNNNSMKSTTAVIGEDGVRKQLASWNPERAGIAVSPMDTVDTDIIGLTSPQPYLQYPHKNSAATGRVVLLSRVPRRQLMRKKMLRKRIQSEVEALQRVHGIETNQFIQRTIAVLALPTELIIVNIFPEGGTLRQLLQKRGKTGTLGVNPTRFYAAEVLLAIEFLHKKGILHRDIKLENVQLGANGHIVLGGFSLALPNFTGIEHEIVGSPQCMAPEMITGEGYGRGVDWWGLGVLVHDMLCGESPFNSDSPEELFHQITHANVTLGHQFSKVTKDFVEGLLVRKPQNRLGGANRGGVFGIRFHHFFTCPNEPMNTIDWNELRKGKIQPPFHLSAITRATAATNAYDQAKDLGFARPPPPTDTQDTGASSTSHTHDTSPLQETRVDMNQEGGNKNIGSREFVESRESLISNKSMKTMYNKKRHNGEENEIRSLKKYGNDYAPTYHPLPMPKPLTAGSTAADIGPSGLDVFGMSSRPLSNTDETGINKESKPQTERPSTRERAIPFQFQLANIQARKTAEHVREEEAAVAYGLAVNRLADMQSEKLVEKELQSQHLLSHPYG